MRSQIYLADQRGVSQNTGLTSYHTFNFGAYVSEGREPFGSLHLLNDDTLCAGASLTLPVEQHTDVLLLPTTGGLAYQLDSMPEAFLEPGQLGVLSLPAGTTYTVNNPYETESINCLQLWLTNNAVWVAPSVTQSPFDLTVRNTLLPIFSTSGSENRVFIGRYGGREAGIYQVAKAANSLFVFVLQGAFEVANRLLQEKDGLALTEPKDGEVEFEALSDEAILIVVEVAHQG